MWTGHVDRAGRGENEEGEGLDHPTIGPGPFEICFEAKVEDYLGDRKTVVQASCRCRAVSCREPVVQREVERWTIQSCRGVCRGSAAGRRSCAVVHFSTIVQSAACQTDAVVHA